MPDKSIAFINKSNYGQQPLYPVRKPC